MTTDFAISALQTVYHTLMRNTTPPEGDMYPVFWTLDEK